MSILAIILVVGGKRPSTHGLTVSLPLFLTSFVHKKGVFIITLFCMFTSGVFAQKKDADKDFTGKIFINAGAGIGYSDRSLVSLSVPASIDFKLPIKKLKPNKSGQQLFITTGAMFFYFSGSAPAYNASNADAIGFAVRPALHITGLNLFKKFFKDADPNKLQAYVAVPVG